MAEAYRCLLIGLCRQCYHWRLPWIRWKVNSEKTIVQWMHRSRTQNKTWHYRLGYDKSTWANASAATQAAQKNHNHTATSATVSHSQMRRRKHDWRQTVTNIFLYHHCWQVVSCKAQRGWQIYYDYSAASCTGRQLFKLFLKKKHTWWIYLLLSTIIG